MKKRCFSKCRGLTRQHCVEPCSYVNEQYCRLSSTFKMIPPDCRLIKRPILTKSKHKTLKRKVRFADAICRDSGTCLSFGKKHSAFFRHKDFTYATSLDGSLITYEREGYTSHATFTMNTHSHYNVAYEYAAGLYLNRILKRTPLFLETYGLYIYPDEEQKQRSGLDTLSSLIPITPDKTAIICGHPELECLLVQRVEDAKPLIQYVRNSHFLIYDALYVFYQVYFTLSMLRKVFTHYDLTCEKVLLCEPLQQGYLEYHYHLPKEVVQFKSSYLVKIQDYRKCYFKGSKQYYEKIVQEVRCDPKKHGFYYFHPEPGSSVNGLYKNESYDLKLLKEYQTLSKMKGHPNKYIQSFAQVLSDVVYESPEGTSENLSHSSKIHNVSDAEKRLRVLIQDPVRQRINSLSYQKHTKLGDIHIYTNGKEVEFNSLVS